MSAPRADWCPVGKSRIHSFHDYSYWGEPHPKCSLCGYVDEGRAPSRMEPDVCD